MLYDSREDWQPASKLVYLLVPQVLFYDQISTCFLVQDTLVSISALYKSIRERERENESESRRWGSTLQLKEPSFQLKKFSPLFSCCFVLLYSNIWPEQVSKQLLCNRKGVKGKLTTEYRDERTWRPKWREWFEMRRDLDRKQIRSHTKRGFREFIPFSRKTEEEEKPKEEGVKETRTIQWQEFTPTVTAFTGVEREKSVSSSWEKDNWGGGEKFFHQRIRETWGQKRPSKWETGRKSPVEVTLQEIVYFNAMGINEHDTRKWNRLSYERSMNEWSKEKEPLSGPY